MKVMQNKIEQVNKMHNALEDGLRRSVSQAIEIGKILIDIKSGCEHGDWLKLFESNIKFSERAARKYIYITEYSDKTAHCADLQSAYECAKQIEYQKKIEIEKQRDEKIKAYKKTGEKPTDWTRADDYAYKKYHDDEARTERIEQLKEKASQTKEQKEKAHTVNFDYINGLMDDISKSYKKFENISQGMSGNEDVIAMIEVKLSKLPDKNRRLEFCNTLIKYLREKAIAYNRA